MGFAIFSEVCLRWSWYSLYVESGGGVYTKRVDFKLSRFLERERDEK